MTKNQQWLLEASKDMLDFLRRRQRMDYLPRGMYEDITRERMLASAIEAVEAEEAKAPASIDHADTYAAQGHASR